MTAFSLEKTSVQAAKGLVVTNHPLASAAGVEVLLGGGNAVDAAVASLFALTIVEPMMIGVLGGGLTHIRTAAGAHHVLDAISTAPAAARGDMFETVSNELPNYRETVGNKNAIGPLAIAAPGNLKGWSQALQEFGTISLGDAMAPAIRLARGGFAVTPYLADCVTDTAAALKGDPALAKRFLPGGAPIKAGTRLSQPEAAESLALIAREGPGALYGGSLGAAIAADLLRRGGILTAADLAGYTVKVRDPVIGQYRGYTLYGPPPPSSAGVHVTQMLNILERFDLAGCGFGSVDHLHLVAEAMKIAFADRAVATADPDFVSVPVDALIDTAYAARRAAEISMTATRTWGPGIIRHEGADTTHVTVTDQWGAMVAATHTLNGLFGAAVEPTGTGLIANNYMFNFDPHPGLALSIEPGKRVFTSMAPMMAAKDGKLAFALGLPGGLRIFPSAMQAILNLIDFGMTPQQAVEAPRIWTEGGVLELEPAFSAATADALSSRGHTIARVGRVAGGMSCIALGPDGMATGAACWRADGTPVGIAGGLARAGVRFTA